MKVNSAELKVHLGRYLREVEQELTTLEICVRDRTVAYLVPASFSDAGRAVGISGDLPALALKKSGMKVEMASRPREREALAKPVRAGDGRKDVITVTEMRRGRDW